MHFLQKQSDYLSNDPRTITLRAYDIQAEWGRFKAVHTEDIILLTTIFILKYWRLFWLINTNAFICKKLNPQHDRIAVCNRLVIDWLKAKPSSVFAEFWTRALLLLKISPENTGLQRELLDSAEHLISVCCYANITIVVL